MKKLGDLRLADWQNLAEASGVENTEGLTVNELIAGIAGKLDIKAEGEGKAHKKALKLAVYDALANAEEVKGSGGDAAESGDAESDSEEGGEKSLEELIAEATPLGISTASYTEENKGDLMKMIDSVKAIRAKSLEDSKAATKSAEADRSRGLKGAPTREIDAKDSFNKLCTNVVNSFSTGIFLRRPATAEEVKAHLDSSTHGFDNVTLKKSKKKDQNYVAICCEIDGEKMTSEKIAVS